MLRFKAGLPPACAFAGFALLLAASRLASLLDWQYRATVFMYATAPWIFLPPVLMALYFRRSLPPLRWHHVAAVVLFILSVLPFKTDYYRQVATASLAMAGFVLGVAGLLRSPRLYPYLDRLHRLVRMQQAIGPAWFAAGGFALFLATAVFLAWYCFDFHPGYTDSSAQYVHGKFVASGHLYYLPDLPVSDFFPVWMMMHDNGKWYSQYPPMHQTLLGIGHFFGVPWLINPLEGALTLVLTYFIARRAYGESIARLAAFLVWASPFILLMSCEFMNHSSSLLFTTLMIFAYGHWLDAMDNQAHNPAQRKKACCWALGVGLSAGYAFLTRPYTAIGVGLPFAAHATWRLWNNRRQYMAPFLTMGAGLLVCVLFQMWYNLQTTGDPLFYAYSRYHRNSTAQAMGIRGSLSANYIFSKTHSEWFWLNINLFEWTLPCSFFVLLACLLPVKNLMTKLLIGVVASQTLCNMANQFSSNVFGPRYLYETATAMIILTAVGIRRSPLMLRALRLPVPPRQAMQGMVALMVIVVCGSGLVYNVPVKIKDYTHFFDSHPDFYYSMLKQSTPPALIFVDREDKSHPARDPTAKFRWTSWTNPPDPDSPVIFARDMGDKKNRELLNYFPNRKAYVEINNKLKPIEGTPFVPAPVQP